MTFASLVAFAGLCLVLSLTPGPDTFLVLRIGLSRVRAGLAAAAGSAGASLVWAALVTAGLAAVLEQSAEVFRWLKIAGGLYLLYLGISSFLKTRKAAKDSLNGGDENVLAYTTAAGFGAGVLSTLLNPKVGLFYLAIVPQFIPRGGDVMATSMILGCIEAVIGFIYLAVVAVVAHKAMAWLRRPRVNAGVQGASSGIITALGAGVIASGASS
ncbi:LysE family translocator [Pseudarthrobacter sp902506025]|uniref:Threonine/homoserine/homoserine lactone efflux protein n=1 Tax=Pseudarthrobacter defluvii TaxID=410837 RepID=A0ABT9UIZ4_9MICC|nr:LysE family translocator [Pseudarthrobacter defluvii]MDQ0118394.1 threonine/homoserine/homoserine lactone efflux protein [Pseudarthrobacter defluvii]